ncbi:uncharacterized protein J3R85_004477 [Psidium guajava]|nr:uncharacterized protein J3R85_004477 [Psidium guajava]
MSLNRKHQTLFQRHFQVPKSLPFDKQDDPPGEDQEDASVSGNQERPASKDLALNENAPSSSPDHQQLAGSFQSPRGQAR